MKFWCKTGPLSLILFAFFACICFAQDPSLEEEIRAIESGLIPNIIVKGEEPEYYSILERMEFHRVPGVSIAVVHEGKLRWAKGYGVANTETGDSVTSSTIFQAGSISKPVAALAALKLAEEGRVDLDTDVNEYLKSWRVKENGFTEEQKVTLRLLLTHSAGMTVHGFPGYTQKDKFPSINKVLKGKGNTPRIEVDTIPGSLWRYSGGGYTVMEKVVEDVTGLPLEQYLEREILGPMGMTRSTYTQPLPEELFHTASAAYDREGKVYEGLWHNYPEQAAAGLWTTPSDLAIYCIEIQQILAGKPDGILKQETVEGMISKHTGDWGLGPSLRWEGDSLRFGHGGKNAGFTASMTAFAYTGDAVIIMTPADNGGPLISEIQHTLSDYYDLGYSEPRVVETMELSNSELQEFVGTYRYVEEVPGIGEYLIEVSIEGEFLKVTDPNSGESSIMTPIGETSFIDLTRGDRVAFQKEEDRMGLLWNNWNQFYRID